MRRAWRAGVQGGASVTETPDRGGLLAWVAAVALAAAVVTPLAVVLSRPAVHGWDDTVGFTAGVAAGCLAIRGLLRRLDRARPGA
jgi:hypothetical protein